MTVRSSPQNIHSIHAHSVAVGHAASSVNNRVDKRVDECVDRGDKKPARCATPFAAFSAIAIAIAIAASVFAPVSNGSARPRRATCGCGSVA